jgi:cyclopropane-fatty-acyl-phospholipid synthase
MSVQEHQGATQPVQATSLPLARALKSALWKRFFPRLEFGQLRIETPGGGHLTFQGHRPGPHASLAIHHWKALWRLLGGGDIGFAEGYIAGDWSTPDLAELLVLVAQNSAALKQASWRKIPRPFLKLRHAGNRNTKPGSRRNIAAHYDLGNEFFARWLDTGMSYSSALYASDDQTLEDAQNAKLARVIALADMRGRETVLEIGCGWGGLAERMIEESHCTLTGITLSARQLDYAQQRLAARDLAHSADLRLEDYRDTGGTYDRIVSVEMLEAVGEAYWPAFFEQVRVRLRPGGIAVLQVITIKEGCFETYRLRPDFIQKYIFPGGLLPTPQIIEREAEAAGLELVGSEFFGDSYARTLAEWQRRFQQAWPAIEPLGFDERFRRIWDYYLAYCRAGFETGTIDVGFYKIVKPE